MSFKDAIPRVGLAGIILNDNKVLLGLRTGSYGAESWAPPGGHLDYLESSFDTSIRREIMEETGLEVGKVRQLCTTNDIFSGEGKHYVTIFMRAEYIGGEPEVKEPDKCKVWKWFDREWFDRWFMEWEQPSTRYLFLPVANLIKGGYDIFRK